MLEQSTWAAHRRIERLATKELHMELPLAQDVVIVK
jgi:cell division protein FtsL